MKLKNTERSVFAADGSKMLLYSSAFVNYRCASICGEASVIISSQGAQRTFLHCATMSGSTHQLEMLLDAGCDVDARDSVSMAAWSQ